MNHYVSLARPFTLLPPLLGIISGAVCAWGSAHNPDPSRAVTSSVILTVVLGSACAAFLNAANNNCLGLQGLSTGTSGSLGVKWSVNTGTPKFKSGDRVTILAEMGTPFAGLDGVVKEITPHDLDVRTLDRYKVLFEWGEIQSFYAVQLTDAEATPGKAA